MEYNLKRALGYSLLVYIATFVVGILTGILTGQDLSSMDTVSQSFWYIGMIASAILAWGFTLFYYRNPSISPSAKSGFLFGLTTVIVSTVLDFILFSIGNMQGGSVELIEYYGDFRFWIIVALVLATTALAGHYKSRQI